MVQEQKSTREVEGNNLCQIINNITSLILLSYTIRVFPIKWQLIRNRLEELSSGLIAMESTTCSSSSHDQVIVDAVTLVYHAVDECHSLASSCINVSYTGKLLMQSDLDKVISKLDLVQGKFRTMYHIGGMISGGLDLIVSRPPVSATKEDKRFYVKDLLNRLKIGDTQMKKQALISLNEAVTKDEIYVKIIVDLGDFILTLVSCFDSNNLKIQEEATTAIRVIAGFKYSKGSLIASGIITQLVRALEKSTSAKARENSIRILTRLTENGDNAWALSAHGGVNALLKICSTNDDDAHELIEPSCSVLQNILVVDEIKGFMIENGAISTFVELINSRDELGQIGSIELLQCLAEDDEYVRNLVVNEGGPRALVQALDPKLVSSFKLRETALRAIETLCFHSADCVRSLINYGFLDQLLHFLRKGDLPTQELALKSSYTLCTTSEDARKSMGDVGFMTEIVNFIDAKSYDIREMSARSLFYMITTVPKNRKKFSNHDHDVIVVLKSIDPSDRNSEISKLSLSIVLSICSCKYAKRIISHSEYVKNIEKLAEDGFSDAKLITRKLSSKSHRFKSMLNGILHL